MLRARTSFIVAGMALASVVMNFAPSRGSDATPPIFQENWSEFTAGAWSEHRTYGEWFTRYAGFGTLSLLNDPPRLELSPAPSLTPAVTHAALLTSILTFRNVAITASIETVKQLREPQPNPWEVGWLIWHYRDDNHFYYLVVKPNGWELGKRAPDEPGGQRFLLAKEAPAFPLGTHVLRVLQIGPTIEVSCDNVVLGLYVDRRDPYLDGAIGLYTEDAQVRFGNVSAEPLP